MRGCVLVSIGVATWDGGGLESVVDDFETSTDWMVLPGFCMVVMEGGGDLRIEAGLEGG